ncbi:hypothetical protein JHL18_07795 [Clostridium sp. YIM B02505]|uniref:Uncharacterized protein n=1 Tax=Clostridium yunnanense TaxID=2800325 RepID=A0ABS1EMF6_9CLOT|nr:hypothetical protein [Clostridium yunnanense]MBK1810536.1 hypothetical protein [Clostridium yunnanense]
MFKKIILTFFTLIIAICAFIFIKNQLNKDKYTLSNTNELIKYNCSLEMSIENKAYNYQNVRAFGIEYGKESIISDKNIEVKNSKLNYCSYQITKDQDYIFTFIDGNRAMFKIKAPLSEDLRSFLVNSFIKGRITSIMVYPFKDTNKLFIKAQESSYFVNLLSKKIIPLNNGIYKIPSMNLKENVLTILKIGPLANITYVFDEDGNMICKFL